MLAFGYNALWRLSYGRVYNCRRRTMGSNGASCGKSQRAFFRKTVRILEDAKVPYAVIGGQAVRAWVAQVDEAALRTTRDVDILVRPSDFPALSAAMVATGFHHRNSSGPDMFLEHAEASARDAVYVILVGKVERIGDGTQS